MKQSTYAKSLTRTVMAGALMFAAAGTAAAVDIADGPLSISIDTAAGTASVTGFTGSGGDVEIPATVHYDGKDYPVVSVADYAFYGSAVESVTFGSNITSVGNSAFYYSTALTAVEFNDRLESIGDNAFCGCGSLGRAQLPPSLTAIGNYSFMSAALSGDIDIPASLTAFGRCPFRGCPVTAYKTDPAATGFTAVDGVLFSADGSTLVSYPGARPDARYVIPAGVRQIAAEAMRNAAMLTSVTLPDGLEAIGELAFAADYITDVAIPATVTTIGRGAFYYNTALTAISVADGNSSFEAKSGLLVDKTVNAVIAAVQGMTDLVIPDGIEAVGDYVFYGYAGLKSVTAPPSLTAIGQQSFYGCRDLARLQLADGIEEIGKSAFQSCTALQTVTYPASLRSIGMQAFATCTAMEEAILNDGLVSIGQSAFYGCEGLRKVRVPGTAREFGYSIFYSCTGLQEAILEEGLEQVPDGMFNYDSSLSKINIPSTVRLIDEAALYGTAITSLDLPDGLVTIGDMAVYGTRIEELDLPDTVESIGEFAFAYNYSLARVKCGKGLRSIGENAFSSLPALQSITLNEGLESIGYEGITFCDMLTSLEIPSTVTEIGSYAFIGCPLRSIVNHAAVPQILNDGEDIVADADGNTLYDSCTLYVPAESVSAYAAAPIWGLFKDITATAGVSSATSDPDAVVTDIYTIDGRRLSAPTRGINIYRMSDGTTRIQKNNR